MAFLWISQTARCITQHFQMSMQMYTNFWSKYMSANIQWVGQQDAVCSGSKIPCELWCRHLATHSRVQSPVNAQWMPSRCRAKIPGRTKIIDRMGHVGTLVFPPKKTKKQPGVRIRLLSSSKFLQTASVTTCLHCRLTSRRVLGWFYCKRRSQKLWERETQIQSRVWYSDLYLFSTILLL